MAISTATPPPTIHPWLMGLTVALTVMACQETTDDVADGSRPPDGATTDAIDSGETRPGSENPFAQGTCDPAGVWRLEYLPFTGTSLRPPEDRVRIEVFDRRLWGQYRVYWDGGCSAAVYIGNAQPGIGIGECQMALTCESRHTNVSEWWISHDTLTITFNGDRATGETQQWTTGFAPTDGGIPTAAVTATRISP